jgi:hypothetical protein
VRAVAHIGRDTGTPGGGHDQRHEAMVPGAVGRRREPGGDAAYSTVDVVEGEVLGAATRGVRPDVRVGVVLRGRPTLSKPGDPGGDHEAPVGADERVAEGLDRGALGPVGLGPVGPVVLVGEVDDGFGLRRTAAQGVQVVQVAAQDERVPGLEGCLRRVGTGQPDHLVPGGDQLVHRVRADPPTGARDEYPHVCLHSLMSVTE